MQIREKGSKIILLRSKYNTERKRNIAKQFKSFDSDLNFSDLSFTDELTDEEKAQLLDFIAKRTAAKNLEKTTEIIKALPDILSFLTDDMPKSKPKLDISPDTLASYFKKAMKAYKKEFKRQNSNDDSNNNNTDDSALNSDLSLPLPYQNLQ